MAVHLAGSDLIDSFKRLKEQREFRDVCQDGNTWVIDSHRHIATGTTYSDLATPVILTAYKSHYLEMLDSVVCGNIPVKSPTSQNHKISIHTSIDNFCMTMYLRALFITRLLRSSYNACHFVAFGLPIPFHHGSQAPAVVRVDRNGDNRASVVGKDIFCNSSLRLPQKNNIYITRKIHVHQCSSEYP